MFHFIFPCGLKPSIPYPMFDDQVAALKDAGFSVSAFPEKVLGGRCDIVIPTDKHVVYRGWMVTPQEYGNLSVAILAGDSTPYVPEREYTLAHYLPNWIRFIQDLTPETDIFPENADFERVLDRGWDGPFFIKDYVKSVKQDSFAKSASEIKCVVDKIRASRGKIEGGICVRKVEDFDTSTEVRYFVISGKPFSPDGSPIPEIVTTCARRIPSRFFSIDYIKRKSGVERIVEIGDGQVSDLVGWTPQRFAEIWKQIEIER